MDTALSWRGRFRRLRRAACAVAAALSLLPAGFAAAAGTATAPGAPGAPSAAVGGDAHFTDIAGNWAGGYIQTLLDAGVLRVPPDGLFRPGAPVTRLSFAVWVSRALELPAATAPLRFTDTAQIPQAERPAVAAAVSSGLLKGFPDGSFQPQAPITRAQLATVLGRNLEAHGQQPQARFTQIFLDGASIPAWALPATILIRDELIYGEPCSPEACFAPAADTTRAEATALIVRFMEYLSAHYHQAPLAQAAPPAAFTLGMWYSDTGQGYSNLQTYGGSLNELIYGGYDITTGGVLQGFDSPRTLTWAAQHHATALWMMVQASSLSFLTNAQQSQALLQDIVGIVRRAGYAGVDFDIEGVPAADGPAYTAFITRAAALLHAMGDEISVAVPSETATDLGQWWDAAYNYPELGRVVDQLIMMAYDYHYAGGTPGPISPLYWDRAVIAYASSVMQPSKVVLGMPAYGYIWNAATDAGTAYWESGMENEAHLYGATITRDAAADEATFSYQSGGATYVGWFVDARGAADRIALAHQAGIGGVMAWRLDYDTTDWWPAFAAALARWN